MQCSVRIVFPAKQTLTTRLTKVAYEYAYSAVDVVNVFRRSRHCRVGATKPSLEGEHGEVCNKPPPLQTTSVYSLCHKLSVPASPRAARGTRMSTGRRSSVVGTPSAPCAPDCPCLSLLGRCPPYPRPSALPHWRSTPGCPLIIRPCVLLSCLSTSSLRQLFRSHKHSARHAQRAPQPQRRPTPHKVPARCALLHGAVLFPCSGLAPVLGRLLARLTRLSRRYLDTNCPHRRQHASTRPRPAFFRGIPRPALCKQHLSRQN